MLSCFNIFKERSRAHAIHKDDGTIRLTRGDTARLTIPIINSASNDEYVMQSGDVLFFTVKKSAKDTNYLFQKESTGTNAIHIKPEDTDNLSFGKYKYDVQLTTASGDVYTIIEPSVFEIMEEIT